MPVVVIQNQGYPQTVAVVSHAQLGHFLEFLLAHGQFVRALLLPHDRGILLQILHALPQQLRLACDLLHYRDALKYGHKSLPENVLLFRRYLTRRNAKTGISQLTSQKGEPKLPQ